MAGAISLGRNVGAEPMSESEWYEFITATKREILFHGGTIYASTQGRGSWDGVAEDNAVITFDLPSERIEDLRIALRYLAKYFHQEAIALLVGETELIGSY